MTITINHNPACETSQNTLAMIRQGGEQPTIIEHLNTPRVLRPSGLARLPTVAGFQPPRILILYGFLRPRS